MSFVHLCFAKRKEMHEKEMHGEEMHGEEMHEKEMHEKLFEKNDNVFTVDLRLNIELYLNLR